MFSCLSGSIIRVICEIGGFSRISYLVSRISDRVVGWATRLPMRPIVPNDLFSTAPRSQIFNDFKQPLACIPIAAYVIITVESNTGENYNIGQRLLVRKGERYEHKKSFFENYNRPLNRTSNFRNFYGHFEWQCRWENSRTRDSRHYSCGYMGRLWGCLFSF